MSQESTKPKDQEIEQDIEATIQEAETPVESSVEEATQQAEEVVSDLAEEAEAAAVETTETVEEVVAEAEEVIAEADDVVVEEEVVVETEEVVADASESVEETVVEVTVESVEGAEGTVIAEVVEVVEETTETVADEETTSESADSDVTSEKPASKPKPRSKEQYVEEHNGLRRGQLVKGVITSTSPTSVTVDLGEEREGVISSRELELMPRKMLEELEVGKELDVFIVNPRTKSGEVLLSINLALEEQDWQQVKEYLESKEVFEDRIRGYNKGGLIVRFGRLRGFVPQSQISELRLRAMTGSTPDERYGKMVNDPIKVKVMEVDRKRNRLIFSERAAMREVRAQAKEELISDLTVGEEREGVVVSLENFGAFVDIGGAEGLVHLTEISWSHITHPRQALKVGEQVKVKVINIDPKKNRIGLSIKDTIDDPWDAIATEYQKGQLVEGVITKLANFGAFAQIDDRDDVEGLVHISEMSDERVEHPREVFKAGDKVTLRVIKIDVANRRLGLSLKKVASSEYLDLDMRDAFGDE